MRFKYVYLVILLMILGKVPCCIFLWEYLIVMITLKRHVIEDRVSWLLIKIKSTNLLMSSFLLIFYHFLNLNSYWTFNDKNLKTFIVQLNCILKDPYYHFDNVLISEWFWKLRTDSG